MNNHTPKHPLTEGAFLFQSLFLCFSQNIREANFCFFNMERFACKKRNLAVGLGLEPK